MQIKTTLELIDIPTLIVSLLAVVVASLAAIKAIVEYRKQGITKRAEIFLQLRSRLREDVSFKNICQLLETDDTALLDIPLIEKDRFIGFFEELALMKNSGFVNKPVCLYMFGYFAVRCLESKNFWHKLNKTQKFWTLFMDFAEHMRQAEKSFKYNRDDFHL
jgi:hypothetical protein